MALVTLKGIHRHHADHHVLRGVDLVVGDGDRIGLVGLNGAGKTTLLRIVAGLEGFEEGERTERRGLKAGYLEQEPVLPAHATAREAVGSGEEEEYRVAEMLARTGVSRPDAPCGELSGGERRRVALARALLGEPDLLLLDEPTNQLDAFVIAWLERFLRGLRTPLLMVTHDRYFLDRIANRIVELDRGRLFPSEGGYRVFVRRRTARLDAERKAESARLNLLRRESEWMSRGPQGRGTKAKARRQRFDDLVSAAREAPPESLALVIPPGPPLGTRVVELEGVGFRGLFDGLDLAVERDDRIGIVGPNGAGKTTLLRICTGALQPHAGQVRIGETVRFARVDQERAGLKDSETVLEAVSGGNTSVKVAGKWVRVESFLRGFLFPKRALDTPVGKLSGGERNRVVLAQLLLEGGNVLVLDEPTNDLDLDSLRALEAALLAFPGAVLVVSHDRWFLDRVATRILCLDGTGRVREWPGEVDALLEELERERRPAPRQRAARPERPKPCTKPGYREQRELAELPGRIEALEAELAVLDARLGDPATYREDSKTDVAGLTARRRELAERRDALYRRWEELVSRGGT